MTLRIAVNGFGRIGRNVLRAAHSRPEFKVMALNHKSSRLPVNEKFYSTLAFALKYDSVHGVFDAPVEAGDGYITVGGEKINVFSVADPAQLPWGELGVDVVVESTGKLNNPEAASAHLKGGAGRVVITCPAKGGECATIVMGVNEGIYDPARDKIISNASCTTNCLAPLVKVLHNRFKVVKGLMTTIHAITNDQQILDMPYKDLRRGRAATLSIVPTSTGAAKAVGLVLPELKGKLTGFAFRVPVPNVSVVDLTVELERPVTVDEVNGALKEAADNELSGILAYSELPLVSTDYNGNPHSCIVDAQSTMVIGNMAKVVAWYDNEWGYAQRVLDMISYMAKRGI